MVMNRTTTPEQLIQYVRFQLDQLSERNAAHDFEHLCRHLARARICSNVLPATGPVSAGGDQGRDFETFRTYLRKSRFSNSVFVGLSSDASIAFACSLQRSKLSTKIKEDVTAILSEGADVDSIHFFCTGDIDV